MIKICVLSIKEAQMAVKGGLMCDLIWTHLRKKEAFEYQKISSHNLKLFFDGKMNNEELHV